MPMENAHPPSPPPSPFVVEDDMPGRRSFPASLPIRAVCRIVTQMTCEMAGMLGDRVVIRRDRRRLSAHVRQISMYVCHVALRLSLSDIGSAFGRDRTTVGHACSVVEDRRDDPAFDEFVSSVERLATVVFGSNEDRAHG